MVVRFLFALVLTLILTSCPFRCLGDEEINTDQEEAEALVRGEKEAPHGRFPYMCTIQKRGSREHGCGGSLIDSQWVLTTAHCIDPNYSNSVGLTPVVICGSHTSETNDPDLIFNAVEGHVHPSWTGDVNDGFDVGLLKLGRESNATVPAIDTQLMPLDTGDPIIALGWGKQETRQTVDTLKMAEDLSYLSPVKCESQLGDIFNAHMTCAGLLQDICEGDSGGPLLLPDSPAGNLTSGLPKADLLVAVASFGLGTCNVSVPGVYIRIACMWNWILSVIDEQNQQGVGVSASEPLILDSCADIDVLETEPSIVESAEINGNPTDSDLKMAISFIEDDDSERLGAALLLGLDPNSRHNDTSFEYGDADNTLLHWAAQFGSSECAEVLIANGAEVDAANLYEETPLHTTARVGTTATAEVLLDNDADIEALENEGLTPLHFACFYGHVDVAKVLLRDGAELEARSFRGSTPLHLACTHGHNEVVKVLLKRGADMEALDDGEYTPLHWAAYKGHSNVVKVLFNNGADIEARDDEGLTPLHLACINGSVEVVQVLSENGAELEARSLLERTPLHIACMYGHDGVVEVLLKRGADIEALDEVEATPLHWAAFRDHSNVVKVLLNNGADIEAKEDEGLTPLHLACINGSVEVVQVLLIEGAEVEARSWAEETPLHMASKGDHESVVLVLLNEDADVDALDNFLETPLHEASEYGCLNVARILVNAGASKTIVDSNGDTPYDVICSHEDVDCSDTVKNSLRDLLSP